MGDLLKISLTQNSRAGNNKFFDKRDKRKLVKNNGETSRSHTTSSKHDIITTGPGGNEIHLGNHRASSLDLGFRTSPESIFRLFMCLA